MRRLFVSALLCLPLVGCNCGRVVTPGDDFVFSGFDAGGQTLQDPDGGDGDDDGGTPRDAGAPDDAGGPAIDAGHLSDGGGQVGDAGAPPTDGGPVDAGVPPVDGGVALPAHCDDAGLCIELTWAENSGDLDLHLSLERADWCTDDTCYFGNCTEDAPEPREWDGEAGFTSGDPFLVDDTLALGPEVLTIASPRQGNYAVGVYAQPDIGPFTATVRITSFGVLIDEQTTVIAADEFWRAGTIVVTGDAVSFNFEDVPCGPAGWVCTDPVALCDVL